jgi:hypothetical protein
MTFNGSVCDADELRSKKNDRWFAYCGKLVEEILLYMRGLRKPRTKSFNEIRPLCFPAPTQHCLPQ